MTQKRNPPDQPTHKSKITVRGKSRIKARDIVGGNVTKRDEYNAQTINVTQVATPPISDAEYAAAQKKYLEQVIARTELLEFIGIPEHGKRQRDEIKLEDIFIPLGAEEEIEEFQFIPGSMERVTYIGSEERGFDVDVSVRQLEAELSDRKALEQRLGRKSRTTRRVTLNDALRNHTHIMVVGDPGAGKSTLLRYLTLMAARAMGEEGEHKASPQQASPQQERRLPILIPLRSFAASDEKSLVAYFYSYVKQTYQLDLPAQFFERALEQGICLMCFDGLDEVVVSDQRVAVRDAVAALALCYPRNRFVVTSRSVGYEQAPLDRRTFAHHTVLPFTNDEINTFVHKWYHAREHDKNHAETQANALVKTIQDNDRLLKLAENPLMLTIIALVHRIEAELPNERVKLYDKCTEALLGTWEGVKGLGVSERERERPYYKFRRRLLEKLAFWMHTLSQNDDRQAEVKRGDLEMKLIELLREDDKLNLSPDDARIEAQTFIEMAKRRTGILVERADGVYSFLHLTFQEYFAACDIESRYIYNLDQMWRVIQPHLYDPRWREVILLLLGRLNRYDDPPSILVERILNEHDRFDDVIHRNLFFATRCIADHVNVSATLHDQIVDQLLQYAHAESVDFLPLRDDTIRALGRLTNDQRVVTGLLALVQDKKTPSNIVSAAADALVQLGRADDLVIQSLLAFSQGNEIHPGMRRATYQAFAQLSGVHNLVLQELFTIAKDDRVDLYLRRTIAQVLEQLGDTNVPEHFLKALAQNSKIDAGVRRTAAQSLAQLGRTDIAIEFLLALAQDNEIDAGVRRTAAQSLAQLGRTDIAIEVLLALVQDNNEHAYIRSDAIQAIAQLGGSNNKVIQRLLELAQDDEVDSAVRSDAAQALIQFGHTEDAIQFLLTLAQDSKAESYVRIDAIRVLAQLGQTYDAIRLLLILAQDDQVHQSVRCTSIQELARLQVANGEVIQGLLALAQNEKVDSYVRSDAAQALAQLGYINDAVHLLLTLIEDNRIHPSLRRTAAQALAQLGVTSDEVIQSLLALAQDDEVDSYVRRAIAQTLAQLGFTNAAVKTLLALVQEGQIHPSMRRTAAQALGQLRVTNDEIIQELLTFAQDNEADLSVRLSVVQALAQLGRTDDAIRFLIIFAQNDKADSFLRSNAIQSLAQLGVTNDGVIQGLLALVQDDKADSYVRSDAAQALAQLRITNDEVIQELVQLAQNAHENSYVRRAIAQALVQVGRDSDVLIILLAVAWDNNMDSIIRGDAVQVLVQLGGTNAAVIRGLLALAQDNKVDTYVRSSATQALAQLAHKQSRVAIDLLKITKSKSQGVRDSAYSALKEVVGNLRYADLVTQTKPQSKRMTPRKKIKSRTPAKKHPK
ncbi:MAG: HEAT repeat domain-containing protein [Chloroflexi bacterium]|nr:HEAT repeat domain-containing protein [Chloroflexota bacterium]MBI4761728.1 HEAT repeat domain-containing protein [Chloroflexota bacterium]